MATKIKSWEMPSSTNPAKKYTVIMWDGGEFSCNCPRWTFKKGENRNCPHIIGIQSVLRLNELGPIEKAPPKGIRKIVFEGN